MGFYGYELTYIHIYIYTYIYIYIYIYIVHGIYILDGVLNYIHCTPTNN